MGERLSRGRMMAEEVLADIGPDRTLLLVDDDESFVKRLARAMERRGFIPETAESVAIGKAMNTHELMLESDRNFVWRIDLVFIPIQGII